MNIKIPEIHVYVDTIQFGGDDLAKQLHRLIHIGEHIMKEIDDFKAKQEQNYQRISGALDDLSGDVADLNKLIKKLQDSQGTISREDQATLNQIEAAGKLLADKADAVANVHTTPVAPAVPTNLTAPTIMADSVTLSWDSSPTATGYNVFRNAVQVGTATSTSYVDTGLTAETNYSYTVSAFDAVPNESAQSSPALSVTTTA